MNGQVTFLPPPISGYQVETWVDFYMQKWLKINMEMLSSAALWNFIGQSPKLRATCESMAFGSQTNNMVHSLSNFFFFWFLFVARQVIQPELHIFKVSFCSMYNWKLQSVTERSKVCAAPLAVPALCPFKTTVYTVQLRLKKQKNKNLFHFKEKQRKFNVKRKIPRVPSLQYKLSQHKLQGNRHEMQSKT